MGKLNRRTLEALLRAGALDGLGPNRASLMAYLPTALQAADQESRNSDAGQNDMFGIAADTADTAPVPVPELPEWSEEERLAGERETLGLFLSGHPIGRYEAELKYLVSSRLGDLVAQDPPVSEDGERRWSPSKQVTVAGLVLDIRRRGGRVSITLDDRTGRLEATFFEDTWNRFRHLLNKDSVVLVEGKLSFDEFINGWRVTAREVVTVEDARLNAVRRVDIEWSAGAADGERRATLQSLLAANRGTCPVWVHYIGTSARGTPKSLAGAADVSSTKRVMERLRSLTPSDQKTAIRVSTLLVPPVTLSTVEPEILASKGMVKSSLATVCIR
jgi:DNA polymerase-3 subunit alpha